MTSINMYHPDLEPPANTCVALSEDQAAVYEESGWKRAPEPDKREGYEPEPVKYAPVEPEKAKPARKSATKTESSD